MGITAKDKGGADFDPIPEGTHTARCYGMFDLGTQHNEKFNKSNRQVMICWELPSVRIDVEKDGQTQNLPRAFSQKYTVSLHEKSSLRKTLQSWRGKAFTQSELDGFDVTAIVGAACQIQIIHQPSADGSKVYANMGAIMPIASGATCAGPENPQCVFSFEDDGSFPEGMPEWVQKIAMESPEYIKMLEYQQGTGPYQAPDAEDDSEDDLPF